MPECRVCEKTFSGKGGGHCVGGEFGGCCQTFGSNTIGDAHRIGHYSPPRKGTYIPRRCLTVEEMIAKGWHQDDGGAWRLPGPKNRPASWAKTRGEQ
jgi:hypothetical protein